MVVTSRLWCSLCLGVILLAGCKNTAKHDNPVFGASPRRTSLEDAPNAKAIADAEDLNDSEDAESNSAVQLASQSDNHDEQEHLFNTRVVARVNGVPIFAGDVLQYYYQVDYLTKVRAQLPPEDYDKVREALIRQDLKSHIIKQLLVERTKGELKAEQVKALTGHLEKEFDKKVEELKKEFEVTTRTELERKLNERGTSLANMRNAFISQGIAQGYMQHRSERPKPVNRKDLVDYYHDHAEEFKQEAKLRWRQIQITYANAGGKTKALEKMDAAFAELKRGVPFEKVAAKISDGSTAQDGGARDWIQKGALADEKLDELLFSLPANGEPQKYTGAQACQLVQVVEKVEASVTPFPEVQEKILTKLTRTKPTNVKELLDKLYGEAVIETKYDLEAKSRG